MRQVKEENFIMRMAHKLHQLVPLRVKVMGIVVAFVCLLGLNVIVDLRAYMAEILIDQLYKRGNAIASDVATRSVNMILINDSYSLYEMARNVPQHYDDVRYLMIFDEKGVPIAHNFGLGVPIGLLELRDIRVNNNSVIQVDTEEGLVLDVAVPIADGRAGAVRIGMSESSMRKTIDALSAKLVLTTVGVSLLGLLGAYALSHLLTRPIFQLMEASKAMASGDLTQRVITTSEDEIGELSNSFNGMAESLEKYTKEREALLEELTEKEQIRKELLKKVITAQEDERKRISRELHDETSQSLTSLKVGLKFLGEINELSQMKKMADQLRDLASDTLQEVHRLAVELRPTVLDDMGLIPAMERYINLYQEQYPIDVDLHVQDLVKERLSGEVETAVYRIVQEALTNVAKYAGAENVSVVLEIKPAGVNLIVEDDGAGFDVVKVMQIESREKRLGLAGMQERAILLGGGLTVESEPGMGTTIYVRIPTEWRWKDGSKASVAS